MGETFEGAGLETSRKVGRELRELVIVLKNASRFTDVGEIFEIASHHEALTSIEFIT